MELDFSIWHCQMQDREEAVKESCCCHTHMPFHSLSFDVWSIIRGLCNSGEKLALIHYIRSEFLERNLCKALY